MPATVNLVTPRIDDIVSETNQTLQSLPPGLPGSGTARYPDDVLDYPFMQIIFEEYVPGFLKSSDTPIVSSSGSQLPSSVQAQASNAVATAANRLTNSFVATGNRFTQGLGLGDWIDDFIGDVIRGINPGDILPDFGSDTDTKSLNLITRNANNVPAGFDRGHTTPAGTVTLPMPPTLTTVAEGGWGEQSIGTGADVMGQAIQNTFGAPTTDADSVADKEFVSGGVADWAKTAGLTIAQLGGSEAKELVSASTGVLINPRMALLFKGRGFRTFAFDYVLSPRNPGEVRAIKDIIRLMRKAAYPSQAAGIAALGIDSLLSLKYPQQLRIGFYDSQGRPYQGNDKALPRLKPCVISSLSVAYSSAGDKWAALHDDPTKFPTHVKLTFTVQETSVLTTADLEEGY